MARAVQNMHQICGYNLIENGENSGSSGEKGKERKPPQWGGNKGEKNMIHAKYAESVDPILLRLM